MSTSDHSVRRILGVMLRGFAMGSADVVPGVSGGTVAFVSGIYEALVESVSTGSRALLSLATGRFRRGLRQLGEVEWWFLVPLVVGAGAAVFTLAAVLEDLLRDQPVRMAGFFFGLIAGTIFVAWRMIRRPQPHHAFTTLIVGVLAFAVFGFQGAAVADPSSLVFVLSGMLAIVAFVLPGISGSFILLSIGMYQPVIGAVADRSLSPLLLFGAGAVVGLAVFSQVLDRLLARYHDRVVAALIGLMLGSFRILWPWPNGLGGEDGVGATELGAPAGDVSVPILVGVVGVVLVIGLTLIAERRITRPGTWI